MAMRNEENTGAITKRSYDTLAISWVNGLSLFGAFWVPIVFTYVVQHIGYTIAWLFGGILSLLFIYPHFELQHIRSRTAIETSCASPISVNKVTSI